MPRRIGMPQLHAGKFYVCTDGATHPHPEADQSSHRFLITKLKVGECWIMLDISWIIMIYLVYSCIFLFIPLAPSAIFASCLWSGLQHLLERAEWSGGWVWASTPCTAAWTHWTPNVLPAITWNLLIVPVAPSQQGFPRNSAEFEKRMQSVSWQRFLSNPLSLLLKHPLKW